MKEDYMLINCCTWKAVNIVKMYANGSKALSKERTPIIQVRPMTTTRDMEDLSHCLEYIIINSY